MTLNDQGPRSCCFCRIGTGGGGGVQVTGLEIQHRARDTNPLNQLNRKAGSVFSTSLEPLEQVVNAG